MALLAGTLPSPFEPSSRPSLLGILSILALGLMGLRLPSAKLAHKILFTVLEFGLILTLTLLNNTEGRFFPLLWLVVVIRSCLIFRPWGRFVITGLAYLAFLLTLFFWERIPKIQALPAAIPQAQLNSTVLTLKLFASLSFGLTLTFVLLLISSLVAERHSREKLAVANRRLQRYALRIKDQAALEERNRIARDIHDSLGHSLTALNIQLEGAQKLWQLQPHKAQTMLAEAKRLGSTALQQVRQSVSTMRSGLLNGKALAGAMAADLPAAIAALIEESYRTTGIFPDCQISLPYPLPDEIQTAVYRITQEALTNISKHAKATEVRIDLRTTATRLVLRIEDNGRGFPVNQNTTGFGIQGMRERTAALGGHFKLVSRAGAGCQIRVSIPVEQVLE